jgi:hypothetical protein
LKRKEPLRYIKTHQRCLPNPLAAPMKALRTQTLCYALCYLCKVYATLLHIMLNPVMLLWECSSQPYSHCFKLSYCKSRASAGSMQEQDCLLQIVHVLTCNLLYGFCWVAAGPERLTIAVSCVVRCWMYTLFPPACCFVVMCSILSIADRFM